MSSWFERIGVLLVALVLVACGGRSPSGANLQTAGAGPAESVFVGTTATFTMTVRNAGPNEARNVRITNTVGNLLALTSISCASEGGAVCPLPSVTMQVPALPVGGQLVFTVNATVVGGGASTLSNTITAANDDEIDRQDNTATAVAQATSNNVTVTGTAPPASVAGGQTAVIPFVVTNRGPDNARDVDLALDFSGTDGGLTLGGAITCTATGGAICPATPGATMRSPSIPKDGTLSFEVPVTVTAGANGNLAFTLVATAAGDGSTFDNTGRVIVRAVSANLGLSLEAPATANAGSTVQIRLQVSNPGPADASSLVIRWNPSAPFPVAGETISCTATGGASCPVPLGREMTLPSLAVGRTLVFLINVPLAADARGELVSEATVSAVGDPEGDNNVALATTRVIDQRNGLYKVYAADGREYEFTVDFDRSSYTMAGDGFSKTEAFAPDGAGSYIVGGDVRFRVAEDLVVGAHGFGAGVLPYVAVRRFVTAVPSIGGAFNLMTRNASPDGSAPYTRPGTMRISGNTLQVCLDDFEVVQASACSVASLASYTLSVTGDVFTATDVTGFLPPFTFRVARSGATDILLGAGLGMLGDGTLQFSIALPETAGLAGGRVYGPGVYGNRKSDWLTMEVTRTTYAALGSGINDVAALERLSPQSPVAMLSGKSAPLLGGSEIWVMQAFPLVVVSASPLGTPNASGLLQIALP